MNPPKGSPCRAPIRDVPFPGPSFICLSKSSVNQSPCRFPNVICMERDAPVQNLFLNVFPSPLQQSVTFLSISLVNDSPSTVLLWIEMLIDRALFCIPFRVPSKQVLMKQNHTFETKSAVKGPSPVSANGAPVEERWQY